MRVLVVYGTGGGDFTVDGTCTDPGEHWWHCQEAAGHDSAWWTYLRTLGCRPFRAEREFTWTGDVDGLIRFWPWNWFRRRLTYRDWAAGADALINYVAAASAACSIAPAEPWALIAHSHGGQVALYAAARGLEIPILITVGTPHRSDLREITELARPRIKRWVHVFDAISDRIALAGQLGDGAIDVNRKQPFADVNIPLHGVEHSRVLRDRAQFQHWPEIFRQALIGMSV